MPIQEVIISQMDAFINESAKEGIINKIKISQNLIALLYSYLKELGVSDEEMNEYYKKLSS